MSETLRHISPQWHPDSHKMVCNSECLLPFIFLVQNVNHIFILGISLWFYTPDNMLLLSFFLLFFPKLSVLIMRTNQLASFLNMVLPCVQYFVFPLFCSKFYSSLSSSSYLSPTPFCYSSLSSSSYLSPSPLNYINFQW